MTCLRIVKVRGMKYGSREKKNKPSEELPLHEAVLDIIPGRTGCGHYLVDSQRALVKEKKTAHFLCATYLIRLSM